MSFKRFFPLALAALCAFSLLTTAAFAHGCHGSARQTQPARQAQSTRYAVCPVEDCTQAGRHYHDGTLYCGNNHANGWCDGTCVSLCPVEGCTLTGRHSHDGVTYCGNNHECGFCDGSCLPLCTVEGCTLTGRHSHNGVTYCGSDHACGFCDGTCPAYGSASSRGHHGGSHR